ncbi:DUF1302 domain-containing protein [Massilia cavernae]|uniref:DUF1302 domain-containing protein n=1 Tax=Massilia cavernae TaxID=2320864 RepID=A0A418X7Q4_9BURK|nr:DUF1302 domain-containing protein [Massilia cavernae]RJG08535.1 DUF1302 domain-containing protein [Massilia cavernae]
MHTTPTGAPPGESKPVRSPQPFARHALAAALYAIGMAQAAEIQAGNPDLSVRFDNTIKYNYGHRVSSQDTALLKSPNFDDGNRNFDKGMVSNRVDWLSELDVVYQKQFGMRVSAAAWYDGAYGKLDNTNVASSNHRAGGKPALGLSDHTKRYHRGSGEILDAFVFANFDVADMPLNVKLGQHTLFWGEALLSPIHSISYGQSPVDLLKGYSVPGTDAKELFLPRQAISAQFSPTAELGIAAQYFFNWKPARLPESGSFLGFYDYAFQGGESFFLGPLGTPALRGPDSRAPKTGDFGLSARWSPDWLDGTAGAYLRRTSELLPQANVRLAGLPTALFGPSGSAICQGMIPGAAVVGNNCLFYPSTLGATSQYQFEYANGIDVLGLSLSKSVAGVSLGADLSYRRDMPLYSTPALLMPAGTNAAVINALNAKVAPALVVAAAGQPQQGEVSGARGNTIHGLVNLLGTTARTPLFDASTWAVEGVWSRVDKVTQGAQFFRGRASYNGIDKVSRDFFAVAAIFTPTWFQVVPGVDMQMPLSYSRGLKGNSGVQAGGNKGAGNYAAGVSFDVRQKYRFDLKYVNFFGPLALDPATGAVTSFGGVTSLLKDRGFLAATFKTTF